MPVEWLDYDSGSAEWTDVARYPTRAIGATEWYALPPEVTDQNGLKWLRKLQSMSPPSRRCPRLFIAHLASDRLVALKMARIASECGFHFWLDVLDPQLPMAVDSMVGTSAVIEMAVLNCTHVISIGSASPWMNYAFGRIRTRAAYQWQAAIYGSESAPGLGVAVRTKAAIQDWLNAEFAMTLGCPRRLPVAWPDQPQITSELD